LVVNDKDRRESEMKMTLVIFVIVVTAFAYFIGLLAEAYKRFIRKGKASDWENRLVAFGLSAIFAAVLFFVFDASALLSEGVRNNPALIVVYTVCLYLLQLPACMGYWKPIFKKLIERKVQ